MANDDEEEKRDTLPAPPPTAPEHERLERHPWCGPELGPCTECDSFPQLRAMFAQRRDEAGRA